MRSRILTAALTAGGFLTTSGPADAQYGYPYRAVGGYYLTYGPAPRYTPPQYQHPYAPAPRYLPPEYPPPVPYSGYAPPWYGPQSGGSETEFVRSLYLQHLGREPDSQGMSTWLRRLAETSGDTDQVIREFIPAARLEVDANRYTSPAYPPRYR